MSPEASISDNISNSSTQPGVNTKVLVSAMLSPVNATNSLTPSCPAVLTYCGEGSNYGSLQPTGDVTDKTGPHPALDESYERLLLFLIFDGRVKFLTHSRCLFSRRPMFSRGNIPLRHS